MKTKSFLKGLIEVNERAIPECNMAELVFWGKFIEKGKNLKGKYKRYNIGKKALNKLVDKIKRMNDSFEECSRIGYSDIKGKIQKRDEIKNRIIMESRKYRLPYRGVPTREQINKCKTLFAPITKLQRQFSTINDEIEGIYRRSKYFHRKGYEIYEKIMNNPNYKMFWSEFINVKEINVICALKSSSFPRL